MKRSSNYRVNLQSLGPDLKTWEWLRVSLDLVVLVDRDMVWTPSLTIKSFPKSTLSPALISYLRYYQRIWEIFSLDWTNPWLAAYKTCSSLIGPQQHPHKAAIFTEYTSLLLQCESRALHNNYRQNLEKFHVFREEDYFQVILYQLLIFVITVKLLSLSLSTKPSPVIASPIFITSSRVSKTRGYWSDFCSVSQKLLSLW